MKKALITGVTGQDGSYLAELLLSKGYEVHGLKRRASSFNTERVDGIYEDIHGSKTRFFMHYADLTDGGSITRLLYDIQPEEIYNLGAQSHVKVSFDVPEYTADVVATGTLRLLEAIHRSGLSCRFYQASSSEMFGSTPPPQSEASVFHPRSPYACAKLFAHSITVNYRESYGLHASCGILFNHESPRRGETFVTRKITRAIAHIKCDLQKKLYLGNLSARRDWGYAPDYVLGMWMMLQQDSPDDYVIGTGEAHSVQEFVELAFAQVNLDWRDHVEVDPRYFRPAEVDFLLADASKAKRNLGWKPSVSFEELVRIMVDADINQVETELAGGVAAVQSGKTSMIDLKHKRVVVTGGAGFLGSQIVKQLREEGCQEVFAPRSSEFDLTDPTAIERLFARYRPDIVIHGAALCGGIGANRANPGRFFYVNAIMGIQLIEAARRHGTEKTVVIGTICAYPKFTPAPFSEDSLWHGYPEETNAPYGLAKKMLLVQCQAYREQYGMNAIYLLPVNLYGPGDNFDPESSHVIPALIRKCLEALSANRSEIVLWGDGSPTREFLYVEDAATAIVAATKRYNGAEPVNIGSGSEISIRDLADKIAHHTGFRGKIIWDASQPNGQPRRCLDVTRAQQEFGFHSAVSLDHGLDQTIAWYLAHSETTVR